jgi:hypothetical protein
MTSSYAEDSESTEPSDDTDRGHSDPVKEFEGELMPDPPSTATEDPDTMTAEDAAAHGDGVPDSPGVG